MPYERHAALKIVAFLQRPALELIFSSTWVVLIFSLENKYLKGDDF